jgi:malonate transporter
VTKILLDTLIPIFAGLLLGYVAGRRGTMDNRNVRDLIVLVMDFAIPCALFSTIIGSSRTSLLQHVPAALMITLVFCALYLISYIWARRWRGMSLSDASVLALTIGFPNSAAIALPLFRGAYGPESTVTAALSIVIGSITISPLTLALLEAAKHSGGNHVSATQILRSLPRALLQPVVWAPLVALFAVFFQFHVPSFVAGTLTTMGSAATGSALVLTGLIVSAQSFRFTGGVAITTVLKLVGQPLFAIFVMLLFRMSHKRYAEHHCDQRNSRRFLWPGLRQGIRCNAGNCQLGIDWDLPLRLGHSRTLDAVCGKVLLRHLCSQSVNIRLGYTIFFCCALAL